MTYDDDSSIPDDEDDNEEEDRIVPIRVDPDDSVATVMHRYEASGLWQRRAHAENLHQTWAFGLKFSTVNSIIPIG